VKSSESGQYASYGSYYPDVDEGAEQLALHMPVPQARKSKNGAMAGTVDDSEHAAKL